MCEDIYHLIYYVMNTVDNPDQSQSSMSEVMEFPFQFFRFITTDIVKSSRGGGKVSVF